MRDVPLDWKWVRSSYSETVDERKKFPESVVKGIFGEDADALGRLNGEFRWEFQRIGLCFGQTQVTALV